MRDIASPEEIREILSQIVRGEDPAGADRVPTIAERLKAAALLSELRAWKSI